jgi:putative transposase
LKLLNTGETIIPFLEEFEIQRRKDGFLVLGYVVMPDHVHLVIHPTENTAVGSIIGEIKKRSSYRILSRWKQQGRNTLIKLTFTGRGRQQYAFWQPRGYDHNCRTADFVREKINYCHRNPVKAGLVSNPGDWPWSSYRWYQGDKSGFVHIDAMEY